jgi:hypothetical protein
MLTYTHQREAWQSAAEPVRSSDRFEWSDVDLFVIHYPGGGSSVPDGDANDPTVQAHLRAGQHDYLVNRGYSYGYNVCVDWRGQSWEIRGEDFECAANRYVNGRAFAVQLMVDHAGAATEPAIAEVNRLIGQAEQSGAPRLKILGHRDTTIQPYRAASTPNTDCPGTGVYAQLRAGRFRDPGDVPPPPPPPPPPPGGVVALEPWGTFEISNLVRWPSQVADAVYGNASLWPWIANFNPPMNQDNYAQLWPKLGQTVKVPPLPAALGATRGHQIAGGRVIVPSNVGPAGIVGVLFPNESFAQREARVPALHFWNGGPRTYHPGEEVFVPA